MKLKYSEFKKFVDQSRVFLPYRVVLEEMIHKNRIERLTHSAISSSVPLEYSGEDLTKDILGIRKDHYVVSVTTDNLPTGWLRFNEVLHDFSLQCTSHLAFYVPYYDLDATTYFRDFSKLDIKKRIILYPPEKHYKKEDADMAITELKTNGFDCSFSKSKNHAKTYIFDDVAAVIGSFNFTSNGIYTNNELGVLIFGNEVGVLRSFLDRREFE